MTAPTRRPGPQTNGAAVSGGGSDRLADLPGLTGHHCAVQARVGARTTVTVIGDGAVGLSAVLAARRLGAERIILMGRHEDRTGLGREFGATDVVAERGAEGIERVRELTGGDGTHTVLEAVGHKDAYEMAVGVVRAGGVISRVGVPQYEEAPIGFGTCSGATSRSPGDRPPSAPTSRTCCPTFSRAASSRAGCSTAPSTSTVFRTGTAPWIPARR